MYKHTSPCRVAKLAGNNRAQSERELHRRLSCLSWDQLNRLITQAQLGPIEVQQVVQLWNTTYLLV